MKIARLFALGSLSALAELISGCVHHHHHGGVQVSRPPAPVHRHPAPVVVVQPTPPPVVVRQPAPVVVVHPPAPVDRHPTPPGRGVRQPQPVTPVRPVVV